MRHLVAGPAPGSQISGAALQPPVTYAVAAGKHVRRFEFRKFLTDRSAVAQDSRSNKVLLAIPPLIDRL